MSPRTAVFSLVILLSFPALAATQITFDIAGKPTPIEWAPSAFPLRYDIDQRLTQLHPNAAAIVQRAFAAWSSLPDADIRFQSQGVVAATTNGPGISVSVADDLLRGQGAMALTVYSYDRNSGKMTDADIRVDPSLFDGSVNAQLAIQHEVGHTLGLDHSAVISSVMYPFVGPENTPTDLDTDDRIAISTVYPRTDPTLRGATLQGRVFGDGGGIFAAQVVAVDQRGEPIATALTDATGEFTLVGIPAGRYRLYAEPLDGPVVASSLQGTYRQASLKSFPTEFYDGTLDVENGRVYGNLVVTAGGTVRLNPRVIGMCAPGAHNVSLTTNALYVKPGDTVKLTVGGDGFTSGMTQFEVLNPSFRRVSDFEWWGDAVSATYVVDGNAPSGSSVVLVRSGNETATLTGALKVVRPGKMRAARH